MSKLLKQSVKIELQEDAVGEPAAFRYGRKRQRVKWVGRRWRVNDGWWRQEVAREYFQLETDQGLLCDIYRDLLTGEWYLQRIYD